MGSVVWLVLGFSVFMGCVALISYGAKLEQRLKALEDEKERNQ